MSDMVIVPKYLVESLLASVESNTDTFLLRAAIANNEQLMARADAVMDCNGDLSVLDHEDGNWELYGKFNLDAMMVLTMTLANPQTTPGLSVCRELQEEGAIQRREFWEKANAPIPPEPPTLGGLVSGLLKNL